MPARTPEECDELVGKALMEGDLEAALALYEPGASFVVEGGKIVSGTEAIRQVLSGFIALDLKIDKQEVTAFQSGDIALTSNTYAATVNGPDGNRTSMTGTSAEVVRRQPDGTWLFVIDNPSISG